MPKTENLKSSKRSIECEIPNKLIAVRDEVKFRVQDARSSVKCETCQKQMKTLFRKTDQIKVRK